MSVVIEPASQLTFKRPLTRLVSEDLIVRNTHTDQVVAFKVKTTAPKQYCVRPNSGKINPGETVQIQVLLQPMKEDPPKDFKCKDKFLVQSVAVSSEYADLPITEFWSLAERETRDKISEHKVRCVFAEADEAAAAQSEHIASERAPAPQVPLEKAGSTTSVQPSAPGASRTEVSSIEREDGLKRQLRNAEDQIEQLKKNLNELRQRRPDASSASAASPRSPSTATTTISAQQQFSIEIVALVALVSFLFGYLFF